MKLQHDLFACSNASDAFDAEHREVPEDQELVHMGVCIMLLVSLSSRLALLLGHQC